MPLQEEQIKWILETVRDSNAQLLKMSGITAGHAMALKILGTAIVAIATAGGAFLALLAMEVFDK
jgi:hypothetical protein